MQPAAIGPVIKRLSLKASPAKAFRHFTENIALWWPLATHSLSQADVASAVFETRAGGSVYEIERSGRHREWGKVLACEPPHRVVFSWVLENPYEETEVEVTFEDDGKGGTDFTLIHRGWEARNREARDMYDQGWVGVLGAFSAKL